MGGSFGDAGGLPVLGAGRGHEEGLGYFGQPEETEEEEAGQGGNQGRKHGGRELKVPEQQAQVLKQRRSNWRAAQARADAILFAVLEATESGGGARLSQAGAGVCTK